MNSKMNWNVSISDFLREASSASPTPGGGSVAALIAALGSSMTSMVCHLSQGEKYAHIELQTAHTIEEMNSLIVECEQLLLDDMASFGKYMEALNLPKSNDEEKKVRKSAINAATIKAIDVPVRLIEVCKAGMLCTFSISEFVNKNVISDLGIGAILFEAAAQSALLTVEINLASLKDIKLKSEYADKVYALMKEIEELKSSVLHITRLRIIES